MCFELALTNLLRGPAVSVLMRAIVPTYCGESGSTAGSERATRAYGIGPSGSGIVPIGLAVGATGFLRERSGRTPTRPVHRAIIRSFFLVLGFSILARSCEAMILAFKGAEYAAD